MPARIAVACLVALAAAGCGASSSTSSAVFDGAPGLAPALLAQARPIGHGPRFHPPATGPVLGSCSRPLGPRVGAHVELFAQNRVVLVAAGIGVRPPVQLTEGRISGARCYGALVTLEPTGVVLVRAGVRATVADLFRSWGQPLSSRRLASFPAPRGSRVRVYVGGARVAGPPGAVALTRHAEIVLEVGPYVPPHTRYTFPPGS